MKLASMRKGIGDCALKSKFFPAGDTTKSELTAVREHAILDLTFVRAASHWECRLLEDTFEDRLYSDPDLTRFYDPDNGWGPDLEFCRGLAQDAGSVLDLGCGTGLFLAHLMGGQELVGVDPAAAMLEIARKRRDGDRVKWIEADARDICLGQEFDLIVMTGHAFQVFLTEEDQRAVLSTISRHLSPNGQFIFDSRNPDAREWVTWRPEESRRHFEHPRLGEVEAWNDAAHDAATGVVTYQTFYRVISSGERFSADSKICFTAPARLANLLEGAGLAVDEWLGDWQGSPFDAGSPEIIPIGRLR